MNRRRHQHNPISYAEIDAWCRLWNVQLSQFEMQAIDSIEELYFQTVGRLKEPLK